jgi:hypothetical protein
MKYRILPLFTLICAASLCSAITGSIRLYAAGFGDSGIRLLDSALHAMDMHRRDLAMPWDAIKPDKHRTRLMRDLFENPLKSGNIVAEYAALAAEYPAQSNDNWAARIMVDAMQQPFMPQYYQDALSAGRLDAMLGINPDTLVNLTMAIVLRQFAAPAVLAYEGIREERKRILSIDIVREQADSLMMLSADAEKANVYQLKAAEIEGMRMARSFFDAAYVPAGIMSHGMSLARTYEYLTGIARSLRKEYAKEFKTTVFNTKYGRIALGGRGNDTYEGEYLLILDAGGNDRYISVSGTRKSALANPVSCIIDLEGNDTYTGMDYSIGCGYFGIGLLYDIEGNDRYMAGDFSLATGVFGVGYLHDYAGVDIYSGGTNTQGMGFFGIGLLIDDAGNDIYTAYAHAQAFAGTAAAGLLVERGGNDAYICSGPFQDFLRYDSHFESFAQGAALGFRPIASGGLALLMEMNGNDTYTADIYAQGTAYWFGLGALYDAAGEDRYQAYQYAQGSGVHFAHGLLWDLLGDDVYVSHGVSQGCGHDIAAGILVDAQGNDVYSAESLSMGGGNANAISLFLELSGDDAYSAANPNNTMGYSDLRRNYGMIGVFADAGGNDRYGEYTANNSTKRKSTYGVFFDTQLEQPSRDTTVPPKNEPALTPPDSLKEKLAAQPDSLFIQASAAPQKFQYNVEPARAALIEKGLIALPFLAGRFSTESARERLALDNIIPRLFAVYPAEIAALLIDSLGSPIYETQILCASLCGRLKIYRSLEQLMNMLQDNDWRIRALAAQQIGELGPVPDSLVQQGIPGISADTLIELMNDIHPNVRARAAYALAQLLPQNIQEKLRPALRDEFQIVRNSAMQGLRRNKQISYNILSGLFSNKESVYSRKLLAPAIAQADTSDPKVLASLILNQPPQVRSRIYDNIPASSGYWQNMAATLMEKDDAPILRTIAGMAAKPFKEKKQKRQFRKTINEAGTIPEK